jgi:hypothetical protein
MSFHKNHARLLRYHDEFSVYFSFSQTFSVRAGVFCMAWQPHWKAAAKIKIKLSADTP